MARERARLKAMGSKWLVVTGVLWLAGCSEIKTTIFPAKTIPPDYNQQDTTQAGAAAPGKLVSAFFGLDNRLPLLANYRVCQGAANADGMPVVFERELEVKSVQAGDFRVKTKNGGATKVTCVTFMPAADEGEMRTVLLVGEFGNAKTDPPETVEIVGNVLSKDRQVNYKGATMAVTPLEAGPTIVHVERADPKQTPPRAGSWGQGSGCPASARVALRVTWAGGIRMKDGDELQPVEQRLYKVELSDGRTVIPSNVADLDDGDNVHLLCFDLEVSPKRVSYPANVLVDPNRDRNPATTMVVPE